MRRADFRIITDTREKLPYDFTTHRGPVDTEALETGDYSVEGFEDVFAVERKSLSDLIRTVTWGRKNFEAELDRANSLAEFVVVIEAYPDDLANHIEEYGRKVHPNSIFGSLKAWEKYRGVPFYWCGSRENAEQVTLDLLTDWHDTYGVSFS